MFGSGVRELLLRDEEGRWLLHGGIPCQVLGYTKGHDTEVCERVFQFAYDKVLARRGRFWEQQKREATKAKKPAPPRPEIVWLNDGEPVQTKYLLEKLIPELRQKDAGVQIGKSTPNKTNSEQALDVGSMFRVRCLCVCPLQGDGTAPPNMGRHGIVAWHRTASHSTASHSTARNSTAGGTDPTRPAPT